MISSNLPGRAVYIVDGSRTPFLKARGGRGPFWPPTWPWPPGGRCWRASLSRRRSWTR